MKENKKKKHIFGIVAGKDYLLVHRKAATIARTLKESL